DEGIGQIPRQEATHLTEHEIGNEHINFSCSTRPPSHPKELSSVTMPETDIGRAVGLIAGLSAGGLILEKMIIQTPWAGNPLGLSVPDYFAAFTTSYLTMMTYALSQLKDMRAKAAIILTTSYVGWQAGICSYQNFF
ncbi:MAG: hypothetical protein ACE5DM_05820, partial [Candidatus Nanoarchaeia archaeon]